MAESSAESYAVNLMCPECGLTDEYAGIPKEMSWMDWASSFVPEDGNHEGFLNQCCILCRGCGNTVGLHRLVLSPRTPDAVPA